MPPRRVPEPLALAHTPHGGMHAVPVGRPAAGELARLGYRGGWDTLLTFAVVLACHRCVRFQAHYGGCGARHDACVARLGSIPRAPAGRQVCIVRTQRRSVEPRRWGGGSTTSHACHDRPSRSCSPPEWLPASAIAAGASWLRHTAGRGQGCQPRCHHGGGCGCARQAQALPHPHQVHACTFPTRAPVSALADDVVPLASASAVAIPVTVA